MPVRKVSALGVFGWQNLGNETTLLAFVNAVNKYAPEVTVSCISPNPMKVAEEYRIPAFPLNRTPKSEWYKHENASTRILRKVASRAMAEPQLWIRAYRYLRDIDLLVMPGTGMLDDAGLLPFQFPYDLFRWSVLARLRKVKVCFISVGAGPIFHPLSRYFIKIALALSDYRSYRDDFSKQYIHSIGVDTKRDSVYPDLVFGLPEMLLPQPRRMDEHQCIVGIGLMSYYGVRDMPSKGEGNYQAYIAKMTAFVSWLLEHGYTVRLILGDFWLDKRAVQDVQKNLASRGIANERSLIVEPILSIRDLLRQVDATDLIVATRFHNLVLATMLNKPTISISYNAKSDSVLEYFGLEKYRQSVDELDVDRLIDQLRDLEENREFIKSQIRSKIGKCRELLDDQYAHIFGIASCFPC